VRPLVILTLLLALSPSVEGRPRAGGMGTLQLNSMTTGATVLIDGKEIGALPLPGPIPLRVGKHTLKITKRGYTEFLDVVTIKRGSPTLLDIDLLPYAGILFVTSNIPGARVFVDGKFEGTTPLEKELLLGKRTIRVTKAGYYDFIATVKSLAGREMRIRVKLRMLPIGTTPYRPKPPPPARWYEKWYVWAGAAGALAVVAVAVAVPVVLAGKNKVDDWNPDIRYTAR
jgi:hypothetical protein